MKKTDILLGIIIGFTATFIGMYIFLEFFSGLGFTKGYKSMQSQGYLGKIITLGAVLNLIIFFILLKLNKELMARGIVLSVIILTIITLFV
jgi:hypothetical protein